MIPPSLRYEPYEEAAGVANVVVDGSPNAGTVLTISHWPGVAAPPGCEADTSAQMAFLYLGCGADLHGDAAVVTNNHFDQDGLAGIYTLVNPDDAVTRRTQLEALAAAGDFAVFSDRSMARLSMAVDALADPARSPLTDLPQDYPHLCAALYRTGLEVLPEWLQNPDCCRDLWADEDAELEAGIGAIASRAVTIEEDPELDLAVVTLPADRRSSGHRFVGRRFTGVHPMALHRATDRTNILTVDPTGGRHELTCRYEGWVQYRSRPVRPRVDLRPLAEALTAAEADGVVWHATAPSDIAPQLATTGSGPPSAIVPGQLVAAVKDHLRQAPAVWNPYAASG
jgi:hypothetical protein